MTFFCKGLLRSGDTVPCFPKLITMEITVGALLLGMGPHIRRLNRKCRSLELAGPANRRSRLRYAVCKAMQVLLTQYCPMLLYLGHLVRQCNWAGETANTGFFASEGLQIVKPVRTPVAIFGSLGVCIYVPASRHWLISYSPIHLT